TTANNNAAICATTGAADTVSCLMPLSNSSAFACSPRGGCDIGLDGGTCSDAGEGCYCTRDNDCASGSKCVNVAGQNDLSCAAGNGCTGSGSAPRDAFDCQLALGTEVSSS